jgi:hypothetical protein
MAAASRIITNPVTGEELTWLVTSEQSGGRLAKAEIRVHGAGRRNRLPHAHPSAREGRVNACGDPGLVLGAALLAEFGDDIAYEVPPRWVQRVFVPPLARLGRRRHPDLIAAA